MSKKRKEVNIGRLATRIEGQYGDPDFTYDVIEAAIIAFLAENKNASTAQVFGAITSGKGKALHTNRVEGEARKGGGAGGRYRHNIG